MHHGLPAPATAGTAAVTLLSADQRRQLLRVYGQEYGLRTFVETGTAEGYTCLQLRDDFDQLHTIEIDPGLYGRALETFDRIPQVTCWYGDSGKVLADVLEVTDGPTLVWLDSHWCAHGHNPDGLDTPIEAELAALIADGRDHVVLVDDCRLFRQGEAWESECYDWPSLTWLRQQAVMGGWLYSLEDDVARLVPPWPA